MDPQTFDLAWIAGIVGVALPLLISLVKKNEWSLAVKRTLAVVASAIAATVTVGLDAGWALDGEFFKLAALAIVDIYVVASVTYNNFFEGTVVETNLANYGSSEKNLANAQKDEYF